MTKNRHQAGFFCRMRLQFSLRAAGHVIFPVPFFDRRTQSPERGG